MLSVPPPDLVGVKIIAILKMVQVMMTKLIAKVTDPLSPRLQQMSKIPTQILDTDKQKEL